MSATKQSFFMPSESSPWTVIYWCPIRREWRPTARLHETRQYARDYAKSYQNRRTRVVRVWIPLK